MGWNVSGRGGSGRGGLVMCVTSEAIIRVLGG